MRFFIFFAKSFFVLFLKYLIIWKDEVRVHFFSFCATSNKLL